MDVAKLDQNSRPTLTAVSSSDSSVIVPLYADPTTHRLLVDSASGSGTVTTVSVVSANGFAGTVANATTTPAITLSTTITGILKGDGTAISAASASTDYAALAFKTISVSGQSDVVADSPIDTLTLVGSGITITTNASTDTITFTGGAASLTVGSTTISSGTSTRILYDNAGTLGEYTLTGSGTVAVMQTSPTLITPVLGVATATSINKMAITAPATSSTLAVADGKTATINNTLTLAGTDSTTMTFPSTSASVARTDAAQTFTGSQTFASVIQTNNAVAASSNAATVPVTSSVTTVTNDSAATLTITITTTSAVNRQKLIVCVLDSSASAQTISWVNTENSGVSVPTTSNGSTTLPLTVGFMYNNATSKWRCIGSA